MREPRTSARALGMLFVVACTVATSRPLAAQDPVASYDSAWAAISRTYWDTAFIATHWRPAHDSIRATLGGGADDARVRSAIRALIAVPRASHFVLIPASAVDRSDADASAVAPRRESRRHGTAGFDVRPLDGAMIVSWVDAAGPAALAGLRAGDELTHVDTTPVTRLRATVREAVAGDAEQAERLVATLVKSRIGGSVGDTLRVTVRRGRGRARRIAIVRTPLSGQVTQYGNLPALVVSASATRDTVARRRGTRGTQGDGAAGDRTRVIARVAWSAWFPVLSPTIDSLLFASRDADALIIDLRGNPGGVVGMIAGISGHLLDTTVSLGELRSRSGVLRFTANPRRVDAGGASRPPFGGPVAILVDEFSASTSEFFSAGMQALGRARVFGTRSAGQALPAAMGRLPSGDVLMHVIADHSDASGRRVEGVGVRPDQATPLRVKDLRAGRDAALDAARAWIASRP